MGADLLNPLRRLYHYLWEKNDFRSRKKSVKKEYLDMFLQKQRQNPKTVFLVLTPQHENIGDHAIALSETEFLKQHGIDYVELPADILDHLRYYDAISIMNGYPIVVQGGGYLGTLWPQVDLAFRDLLKQVPKSPVLMFPNTIFYEDTPEGQAFLQESVELYGKHKKLYLYAREKTSYGFMGRHYRNVKLIPDMVFSLNREDWRFDRKGCILSLRHDQERTRTQEQEQEILAQARALFGEHVAESDMVADYCISKEDREAAVNAKLREFASAELVITDRLHGMVFCAITGTPCLVLNSKSPKVRGCYEWIKDLDYIRFVEDISQIGQAYGAIPKGEHRYDNSHLMHDYQELADDIHVCLFGR